jgi:Rps23 Pro-64 3,4-dihydroxylase Tpa1-like proline 4-hydroxylase
MENYKSMLDTEALKLLANNNSEKYLNAKPYPHIVLDDVFNSSILDEILSEFEVAETEWQSFDTKYEKKLQMNKEENFGDYSKAFIHHLNSAPFLRFLENLTGIKGLLPDPYLTGGGFHKIPKGGKLGIHIDFNQYKKLNVYRRINVLVYLNKDWKEEYGGHFELWSDKKGTFKERVLPIFNRMAIFATTENSYHGHPEPLTCPDDRVRRSIAMYYYTAGDRGEQQAKEHSTVFINEKGKEDELGKPTFSRRVKNKLKKLF